MTTLASIITEDVAAENWQNAYGNMVLKITEPRKLVLKSKEKASGSGGKNAGAKGGSKGGNNDGGSKGFKGDGRSKAWKDEDDEEKWEQHSQKRHKSAAAAVIEQWCWSEHIEIMEAARIDAEAKKALKQLAKADWEEFIAFMKKFKAKFEAEELRKPNNFVIICVRNALEKLEG